MNTVNLNHMQRKNSFYLMAITFVAAIGGLLFGFDMAVISGVLPFVQDQFALSPFEEGWFVSSALIGRITGVGFSGELGVRFGRHKMLWLAAIVVLLSALGTCLAPGLTLLSLARMLGGVGVGVASYVAPLYSSEFAPAKIRVRLVTFYQRAMTVGILVAYLCSSALHSYAIAHQ